MITKLIKKITPYLLIIVAVLGNTGWISSLRAKETKKEDSSKKPDFTFNEGLQCKPVGKTFDYKPEILSWKNPMPSSLYRSYNGQNPQNEIPQSGQAVVSMSGLDSSASTHLALINLDCTTDPIHTIINEIQDISIDIVEPKSFLARNLNEEWKKDIDFHSNQRKI